MINGIKPLPPKEDFDVAVDKLLENIHLDYVNWCGGKNSVYTIEPEKITLNSGRKFIKVIRGTSVWGFIAKKDGTHKGLPMKSGDVFKPAGWASAAKYTRGNIFDMNQDYFRWTGPNYL